MKEIIEGIFLGLLQGLTEFLPVSSSGHLVLAERLGAGEPNLFLNVMLHVGTLAAVIVFYRKRICGLLTSPNRNGLWLYVVASVPTAVLGLMAKKWFSDLLSGSLLPLGFMITAVVLAVGELYKPDKTKGLTYKNAFVTGVVQGLAVFPGISRSGSTITAARLMGADKEEAADFSFMLSIPVILGSGALELYEAVQTGIKIGAAAILAGSAAAFVSGLVALRFMISVVKRRGFWPFVVYMAVLSAVSFLIL